MSKNPNACLTSHSHVISCVWACVELCYDRKADCLQATQLHNGITMHKLGSNGCCVKEIAPRYPKVTWQPTQQICLHWSVACLLLFHTSSTSILFLHQNRELYIFFFYLTLLTQQKGQLKKKELIAQLALYKSVKWSNRFILCVNLGLFCKAQ